VGSDERGESLGGMGFSIFGAYTATLHFCCACDLVGSIVHVDMHMQLLAAVCEASYPFLVSKALEAALQASQVNSASAGSVSMWQALRAVCASFITNNTLKRLRSTVFAALLQQEKLWFQRKGYDAASLAARVTGDCEAVAKIVSINFNIALRYGVQSVGAMCFLVYLNPLIAAYCLVSAATMSIMSLKYVPSLI
jgi:ABC-type multidrug transport system fused ATPase/permease subunit